MQALDAKRPVTLGADDLSGDYYTRRFSPGPHDDTLILNMGPQHPSTHGVLRIIVELDGEYVVRAEPVLGYVHRMHEKMGQDKSWAQFLPNMGRVDYLHALAWNWAYVGAVEKLAGIEAPRRAEFIRVIVTELNRISSHLLWWGAYLLDLGAFTPIMYAFQDREWLMDLLQIPTGSRLTYCYFRFGGVSADLNDDFLDGLKHFVPYMRERLPMYRDLVTENVILRERLINVGHFDQDLCRRYGATGPVLRGSDVAYDVRRADPYSVYDRFDFDIVTHDGCDVYARYLVRLEEARQSLHILEQALEGIPEGPIQGGKVSHTMRVPAGDAYARIESPKGEVGFYVVSDGSANPYRYHVRSGAFVNLGTLAEMCRGNKVADAVVIFGSIDLTMGEVDR